MTITAILQSDIQSLLSLPGWSRSRVLTQIRERRAQYISCLMNLPDTLSGRQTAADLQNDISALTFIEGRLEKAAACSLKGVVEVEINPQTDLNLWKS